MSYPYAMIPIPTKKGSLCVTTATTTSMTRTTTSSQKAYLWSMEIALVMNATSVGIAYPSGEIKNLTLWGGGSPAAPHFGLLNFAIKNNSAKNKNKISISMHYL